MSYYYPMNVHLEATGSNADEVVLCFHERIEVIACKVVAIEADVTGHAANFAEIKVLGNDKATELFKYSTAIAPWLAAVGKTDRGKIKGLKSLIFSDSRLLDESL